MTLAIEDVLGAVIGYTHEELADALISTIKSYGFSVVANTDRLRELSPDDQMGHKVVVPAGVPGEIYDRELGGPGGLTYHSDKIVVTRDDLSSYDRVRVLSHELAHVVLHGRLNEGDLTTHEKVLLLMGGAEVITIKGEIEAELSSYMILTLYGMADGGISDDYIQHYFGMLHPFFAMKIREDVSKVGAKFIFDIMPTINGYLLDQKSY